MGSTPIPSAFASPKSRCSSGRGGIQLSYGETKLAQIMDLKQIKVFSKKEHARLLKLYNLENNAQLRHLICLKIGEEVGELMEEVLALEKIQRKEKLDSYESKVADEIADVLLTTVLLAENLGIGLEKELKKGIKKREERKY